MLRNSFPGVRPCVSSSGVSQEQPKVEGGIPGERSLLPAQRERRSRRPWPSRGIPALPGLGRRWERSEPGSGAAQSGKGPEHPRVRPAAGFGIYGAGIVWQRPGIVWLLTRCQRRGMPGIPSQIPARGLLCLPHFHAGAAIPAFFPLFSPLPLPREVDSTQNSRSRQRKQDFPGNKQKPGRKGNETPNHSQKNPSEWKLPREFGKKIPGRICSELLFFPIFSPFYPGSQGMFGALGAFNSLRMLLVRNSSFPCREYLGTVCRGR